VLSAHHDVGAAADAARVGAEAANAARDLANAPANEMTPERLSARARELADRHPSLSLEVMDRAAIEEAGMGAFAAVARGSDAEPQLITLSHDPGDVAGPALGIVGKAVTFDTGGYSIKPAARMHEMKFDMSGGAAVLEATGAIAALGLPVRRSRDRATENMVSGHAMRPGDIVRARSGVDHRDQQHGRRGPARAGRLPHARDRARRGATGGHGDADGGIVTTFGPVHAGLMGNDDAWCDAVLAAGEATGRAPVAASRSTRSTPTWFKGRYADIMNAVEGRKAHSITAAEFLHRFAGDVPWAHLDIAGASDDVGRPYAAKGASGWGVRLLLELARDERRGAGHALRTPVDRRRVRRGSGPLAMRRTYVRDSTVHAGRNGRRSVALWRCSSPPTGSLSRSASPTPARCAGPSRTTSRSPPRRPAASPWGGRSAASASR
jgi:leucyl aminopeptidase